MKIDLFSVRFYPMYVKTAKLIGPMIFLGLQKIHLKTVSIYNFFSEKILSKIFVKIQLRKEKNMRRCYVYNVQLEMFEHK